MKLTQNPRIYFFCSVSLFILLFNGFLGISSQTALIPNENEEMEDFASFPQISVSIDYLKTWGTQNCHFVVKNYRNMVNEDKNT